MPAAFRFTKRAIEALPFPATGQALYRDEELRGLGLRVGQGSKVFVAEGQLNRRTRRVTIGRADVIGVDEARKRARVILSELAAGRDPTAEKRQAEAEAVTLDQAFTAFLKARPGFSPHSVDAYSRSINLYLKDWKRTALIKITRPMVLKRHQSLTEKRGGVTANNVMRHLRSIHNFTAAGHDVFPPNPVNILTQGRSWHAERRRRTVLSAQALPQGWAAMMEEPDYARDYLLTALLTGMRRAEVGGLRWENVDLKARTLHLPKTKNGDPLDLPLSGFLADLLKRRKVAAGKSPWVFPGEGRTEHIVEPKKFTARVSKRSGVDFTMHDLRRTFITVAESLDIPHYALKRLLNHRISGDVTGGYIVIDAERLRGPVDKVATRIVELARARQGMGIVVERIAAE